jgi:transposase
MRKRPRRILVAGRSKGNGMLPQVRPPTRAERATLEDWRRSADAALRARASAVLMALEGAKLRVIARAHRVHTRTIQHWLHRFNRGGPDALRPRKPTGRPSHWTPDTVRRVAELWERSPEEFGYARPAWSLRLLAQHLYREGITPTHSAETLRTWLRKIRSGANGSGAGSPPRGPSE